jgi:hypothetical protein
VGSNPSSATTNLYKQLYKKGKINQVKLKFKWLMILKNPCKKCLVKICCEKYCFDKIKFDNFTYNILPSILSVVSAIIVASLIMLLTCKIDNNYILLLVLLSIWIFSSIIIKYYFQIFLLEIGGFDELKEVCALISISPILIISLIFMFIFKKINKI